jgi:hypothetical protein
LWRGLNARRLFTGTQRSTPADGEETDETDNQQQNDANDQPESCRIHRLILGEESRRTCSATAVGLDQLDETRGRIPITVEVPCRAGHSIGKLGRALLAAALDS